MALVGWIFSFIALFSALALRQDLPAGVWAILPNMLFLIALLACPMLWRAEPLNISRGQRIAVALTLIVSLPLWLMPAA